MARNMLIQLIASFILLALLSPLASAQSLSIYQDSDKYKYQGCFNETVRALADGASKTYPVDGNMTVPICLSFCNSGTDTQYKYAGVEYSR
ncbi:hypothetical protein CBS470a_000232 [Colletotrichum nupharicola]|nr:hypothetical protein CBS470a_000232 [Colletotrichum nupharicola]